MHALELNGGETWYILGSVCMSYRDKVIQTRAQSYNVNWMARDFLDVDVSLTRL